MHTSKNPKEFILNNIDTILDLINPLKLKLQDIPDKHKEYFSDIIHNNFIEECNRIICEYVTKSIACDYESVILELEKNEIKTILGLYV